MTLLHAGLAVAGLCAIAIPILIHLLARQRRRPVEWAAMRFLIEAFRKHRRRLQLEQLILLAVRCLIVALLGFALARPLLEAAGVMNAAGSRTVHLVIDNGMASGARSGPGDSGAALRQHIAQAIEIVRSLAPGDSVSVFATARPASALLSPATTDHAAALRLLESLEPSEAPSDLPAAIGASRAAAAEAREQGRPVLTYLLSEFRAGSAPLDAPLPPPKAGASDDASTIMLLASPVATQPVSNTQVVAVEPVRSVVLSNANDGSGQVTVRLRRTGGELGAEVTTVRVAGEGLSAVEPRAVQWQPGETEASVDFVLNFTTLGSREAALTASIDDDALPADNQRVATIDLRTQIRVLLVDRRTFGFEQALHELTPGQWMRRALEPLESGPLQIVEAEPAALDLADVRSADVVILPQPDLLNDRAWQVVREFVEQRGLLIVTPPADATVHQWTERLTRELKLPWSIGLETIELDEPVPLAGDQPSSAMLRMLSSDLADLAQPVTISKLLPIDAAQTNAQSLLLLSDGSPLLIASSAMIESDAAAASSSASAERERGSSDDRADTTARRAGPPAAPANEGLVVYLAAAPELSWTNLPSKPLMVPLFHELVKQGMSMIRASQSVVVGDQPAITHVRAAGELAGPQGGRVLLDTSGRSTRPLQRAGAWDILDRAQQSIGVLAVNVDPDAGRTDVQSQAAVTAWLGKSGQWRVMNPDNIASALGGSGGVGGAPIAGLLLALVLALLVLETVLARWFSHAYAGGADDVAGAALRPTISEARPSMGAAT